MQLYYLQNKDEVNKYMADWLEFCCKQRQAQQQNPSPVHLKLRQLKKDSKNRIEATSSL